MERQAEVTRKTAETDIAIAINLDSYQPPKLATGVPFFEHMLEQIAMHGNIHLQVQAKGDLEIDAHHLVEDVGIVMGQVLRQAIGDKKGVTRYGHAYTPLDESLSRVVIDLSGRPGLFWRVDFTAARVGEFDLQLVREFFQGLVNHAAITLHVDNLYGVNAHHQVESLFKAFGRALAMAIQLRGDRLPSTKQAL